MGLSIVGGTIFLQDNIILNSFANDIAIVETENYFVSEPIDSLSINKQGQLSEKNQQYTQLLPEEVLVEHIQIEIDAFDNLNSGKKLSIYIPQEQQDYVGTVENSYKQFGGQVKVSSGSLENGQPLSSFTVTKGAELTLVMVATGEKIYQIEIDNGTGAGTVIDDQSLDYFRKHDDGQIPPPEGIS